MELITELLNVADQALSIIVNNMVVVGVVREKMKDKKDKEEKKKEDAPE